MTTRYAYQRSAMQLGTHHVEHEQSGGTGEPDTSGIAPALTNAIFAATGKRIR